MAQSAGQSSPFQRVHEWSKRSEFTKFKSYPEYAQTFGQWSAPSLQGAAIHTHSLGVLQRLDRECQTRDIPGTVLKGLSLSYRYYPNPLWRPLTDIDLLFAPEHQRVVEKMLSEMGAKRITEVPWRGNRDKQIWHLHGFPVELHFSLFGHAIPVAPLGTHSIPGIRWLGELPPEVNLVYLSAHGAAQHLFDHLMWLVDIEVLLQTETLKWDTVEKWSQRLGARRSVELTMDLIRTNFGPIDTPYTLPRGLQWIGRIPLSLLWGARLGRHPSLLLKAFLRGGFWDNIRYGWSWLQKQGLPHSLEGSR